MFVFFNIPILDLYNNSNNNLGFDNLIDSNSSFDQNKKLGCNEIKSIFAGGYRLYTDDIKSFERKLEIYLIFFKLLIVYLNKNLMITVWTNKNS